MAQDAAWRGGDVAEDVAEALALGVAPVRCAWLALTARDGSLVWPGQAPLWMANAPPPLSPHASALTVFPPSGRFLAGQRVLFTSPDAKMARLVRAAGGVVLPLGSYGPPAENSLPDFVFIPCGCRAKLDLHLAAVPLLEDSWLREALARNFHAARPLPCSFAPLPENEKESPKLRSELFLSPSCAPVLPRMPSLVDTKNYPPFNSTNAADESPRSESLLLCGMVDKVGAISPLRGRSSRCYDHDREDDEESEGKPAEGQGNPGEMEDIEDDIDAEAERPPIPREFPVPRRPSLQPRGAARRIDWGPPTAPPPPEEHERAGKDGGKGGILQEIEDGILKEGWKRSGWGPSLPGRTTSSPAAHPPFPPVVLGEDYYFYLPSSGHGRGVFGEILGSDRVESCGSVGWEGEQVAPRVALGRVVEFYETPHSSSLTMISLQHYEVKHSFLQQNPCTNALVRQTTIFLSSQRSIVPIEALLFDTPVYVVHASAMPHIYILDPSSDSEQRVFSVVV
ncbi:unnamed protein product [Phytomonas sp. Hart1]|nr:unnamed protein product [Phytomonas sp. Hart1]|eukprot:CCW68034.1 unnamed protein product [Phytomonas sp. isolate Hart1]